MGPACFLAAASVAAAGAVVEVGRGDGKGAFAPVEDDVAAGERGVDDEVAWTGSGVMMLIGGVEAALGNSALVGLPDGIDGSTATGAGAATGAFHDGA